MPKDGFRNYYLVKDTRANTHMKTTLFASIVLCLALVGTFTAGRYSADSGRELNVKGNNGRNLLAASSTSGPPSNPSKKETDLYNADISTGSESNCIFTSSKTLDMTGQDNVKYDCVIVGITRDPQTKLEANLPQNAKFYVIETGDKELISSFDLDGGFAMNGMQLLQLNQGDPSIDKGTVDPKAVYFYVIRDKDDTLFYKPRKGEQQVNTVVTELAKKLKSSGKDPMNTRIYVSDKETFSGTDGLKNVYNGIFRSGYNLQYRLKSIMAVVNNIPDPAPPGDPSQIKDDIEKLEDIKTAMDTCTSSCDDKKNAFRNKLDNTDTDLKALEEVHAELEKTRKEIEGDEPQGDGGLIGSYKDAEERHSNPPQQTGRAGGSRQSKVAQAKIDMELFSAGITDSIRFLKSHVASFNKLIAAIRNKKTAMMESYDRLKKLCNPTNKQNPTFDFTQEFDGKLSEFETKIAEFEAKETTINQKIKDFEQQEQVITDAVGELKR